MTVVISLEEIAPGCRNEGCGDVERDQQFGLVTGAVAVIDGVGEHVSQDLPEAGGGQHGRIVLVDGVGVATVGV
ncbi:hypothetical protein D3C86_1674090 [compost metagenome]